MKKIIPIVFLVFCTQCFASNGPDTPNADTARDYLQSSALTAKVRAALIADSEVKSLPITVISNQSTVQLCGFVSSKYQEVRAVNIAKDVDGVTSVIDNINVR